MNFERRKGEPCIRKKERKTYRWRKRDRDWRKRALCAAAKENGSRKRYSDLRSWLAAALCLELLVFSGRQWARETGAALIRRETGCFLEWGSRDAPAGDGEREIYGIRFVPETLEVQFYRRIQKNTEMADE